MISQGFLALDYSRFVGVIWHRDNALLTRAAATGAAARLCGCCIKDTILSRACEDVPILDSAEHPFLVGQVDRHHLACGVFEAGAYCIGCARTVGRGNPDVQTDPCGLVSPFS